ncbi:MAG: hypothetical protein AAGM84_06930 [Pseudomonadota bacterium]
MLALAGSFVDDVEPGVRLGLNQDDAVTFAKQTFGKEQGLIEELVSGLVQDNTLGIELAQDLNADDARLTFSRGVIIDLRNIGFASAGYHHRIRMCMTVCQGGQHSKIWFRAVCRKYVKDGEWADPVHMDDEALRKYFAEAERIGQVALDKFAQIYQRELAAFMETDATRKISNLSLSPEFSFVFRTFDSDNEGLLHLHDALGAGKSMTQWLEKNTLPPGDLVTELTLPQIDRRNRRLEALRAPGAKFAVLDYVTRDGEPGIFLRDESLQQSENRVAFNGVVFDEDAAEPNVPASASPAFSVAAEMLAGVTRRYDASKNTPA